MVLVFLSPTRLTVLQSRINTFIRYNSNNNLKGKIAIITGGPNGGGSGGIGIATAKQLLKRGVGAVALGDIHKEDVALKDITRDVLFKTDRLAKPDQFKALIKAAIDNYKWELLLNNDLQILKNNENLNNTDKDNGNDKIGNGSSVCGLQNHVGVYLGTKHFLIGLNRSTDDDCWHYKQTDVKIFTVSTGMETSVVEDDANKKSCKNSNGNLEHLLLDDLHAQPIYGKNMITIITKGCGGSILISEANKDCNIKITDGIKFNETYHQDKPKAPNNNSILFTQVFIRRALMNNKFRKLDRNTVING